MFTEMPRRSAISAWLSPSSRASSNTWRQRGGKSSSWRRTHRSAHWCSTSLQVGLHGLDQFQRCLVASTDKRAMAQGIAQEIGGDAKEIGLGVGEALLGHDLRQFQPGILGQVLGQCSAAAEAGQMGYQPLAVMDIALQTGIGNLVVVAHGCVPPGGART